jgi:hypothetical protein
MDGQSIQEEVLGRLTWDDRLGAWCGEVKLSPGQPVTIEIYPESPDLLSTLRAARRTLDGISNQEVHLRCAAADELLDWHNDEWNDGLPIRAEVFIGRLALVSIALFPGAGADLYYRGTDLFGGHPIVLSVGPDGEFEAATVTE